MAEQAKKTTAKRKTAARKAAPRKATAKRKPAAKTAKKPVSLQDRMTEAGRDAFLASLGLYGMAYDQIQDQVKVVETELSSRRKKADKLYRDMVKRGAKVEKKALDAIDDIELPGELLPFDRETFEARIEQAKARFEQLKETVGFKTAA
ncbi:MAG: hypothetical protein AAF671_00260 [Pseudomonadota bacterium]